MVEQIFLTECGGEGLAHQPAAMAPPKPAQVASICRNQPDQAGACPFKGVRSAPFLWGRPGKLLESMSRLIDPGITRSYT